MDKGLKTFSAAEAPWNTKAPAIPMVCIDEGSDDRPAIAGYPLPLRITSDPIMGEEVVADDGQQIINFADEYDGGFYRELVAKVNRSDALEKALITAVSALEKTIEEGTIRDADEEDAILAGLKETLTDLGLAHRLQGNPNKAEETVSS